MEPWRFEPLGSNRSGLTPTIQSTRSALAAASLATWTARPLLLTNVGVFKLKINCVVVESGCTGRGLDAED